MAKVLLFGATGHLGKEIAKELVAQGYELTIVVRNKSKAAEMAGITASHKVADITNSKQMAGICKDFEIVVSALGKSISLLDKSKPSFTDIDFTANSNIIREARKYGVRKFVYVSALHAEKYKKHTYFKAHNDVSEQLKKAGINYSIIKPAALFSSFMYHIDMAAKGKLINVGKGDKKTNPIYEGDLAKVCVNAIKEHNAIIEVGGKNTYTRKQINEIIQNEVAPQLKMKQMYMGNVKLVLPLIKAFNRNTYDKYAFHLEVMQHHAIAPRIGEMKLEEYVKREAGKTLSLT